MPLLPGAEPFASDGPSDGDSPEARTGVLLCHGFTGSPQSLRPWADHLAAAGLTVTLPRLPGHGTTWQEMALTRWQDWYAVLDRALDDLHRRCDHVVVMGLSMGGTLAVQLAEEHGARVAGLVLVNPSLMMRHPLVPLLPVLGRVVPSIGGIASDIKKEGPVEVGYDRVPLRALASLTQLWALTRRDLPRVTQPVLLLRSTVDHVVAPDSAALLLRAVSSADVEERLLHDSYHVATLDNDAPEIFAASLDFTRRVTAASRPASGGDASTARSSAVG